jgi:hypothetical protein
MWYGSLINSCECCESPIYLKLTPLDLVTTLCTSNIKSAGMFLSFLSFSRRYIMNLNISGREMD